MSEPIFEASEPLQQPMMSPEYQVPMPAQPAAKREKQFLNVYTVMLFISLVALIIGIIALWIQLQIYGGLKTAQHDFPADHPVAVYQVLDAELA